MSTNLISFATRSSSTGFVPSGEVGLAELGRQVMALLRERRELARERARLRFELHQYSDRGLADMGMSRGDIEDVVHGRFRVAAA